MFLLSFTSLSISFWKFVVPMCNVNFVSIFIFDVYMFVFMASMSLGNFLFVYDVYVYMTNVF